MELNPQSGANNVTPSPENKENVTGIQTSGGRISDSANGQTSRQALSETKILASGVTNATPSSSAKPSDESTRIMVAGGTSGYGIGTTCHQCRQSNRTLLVTCKNQKKNKPCCIKICHSCLRNRYEENPDDVDALADWSCPKCRGICNCSVCMRRKGQDPTGVLHKKARATDEMRPKTSRTDGSDTNDYSNYEDLEEKEGEEADIPLPVGTELTSVLGLDVRAEDIGNALQFLEFYTVFEEVLGLKKGEAENILREILHGGTASPGGISLTVQFHIQLMTLLKCPSDGENSWFQTLKRLLKASEVDSLSMAADYDTLSVSEKLRVLNLLCDEVLGTEELRNWMEKENNKFLEIVREAKTKARSAKGKEKSLKQKMKDDVKKAIIAKDGAPLSFSEHETIISHTKSEAAQAHAEVLESENTLRKSNETCNALRIEPFFMEHRGNVYWKLTSSEKSYVLQQNIGKGDMLTLDDKWYTLDDAGIKMIEKHICSREKKFRKRKAPEASSSQPQTESPTC